MDKFLTEALKTGQGVELGDALSVGGLVTGVGLGIVFGVLIILMIVLMLFKVFFYKKSEKPIENTPVAAQPVKEEKYEMPEDKIVAVLVAAIAASQEVPMEKIRIKSIKKI